MTVISKFMITPLLVASVTYFLFDCEQKIIFIPTIIDYLISISFSCE